MIGRTRGLSWTWLRMVGAGALLVITACVLALAHPGSARTGRTIAPKAAPGCVNGVSVGSSPLCVQTGHLRPRRRPPFKLAPPGTIAPPSALSEDREFSGPNEGVALASENNADYPALTTNGGRTWRIAGPPLHIDAADGAEAVSSIGLIAPRTFFAYGNSVVDVTTDGGRTWWAAYLGEQVMAVVPSYRNELVAYVSESASTAHLNPAVTWQYVSRDGGRHWHYSTDFAGIPG